jgi:hypothetical protein
MVLNLFPKADYPEDQRFPHTILYLHGAMKGSQAGSFLGLGIGSLVSLAKHRKIVLQTAAQGAGIGLLTGTALLFPLIASRMHGKDEIEWKDRSWRLQRNQGQVVSSRNNRIT